MSGTLFQRKNIRGKKKGGGFATAQMIRGEYQKGATQGELCRKWGYSIAQIGRIVRGEVWNVEVNAEGAEVVDFDARGSVQLPSIVPPLLSVEESQRKLMEMLGKDILAEVGNSTEESKDE